MPTTSLVRSIDPPRGVPLTDTFLSRDTKSLAESVLVCRALDTDVGISPLVDRGTFKRSPVRGDEPAGRGSRKGVVLCEVGWSPLVPG